GEGAATAPSRARLPIDLPAYVLVHLAFRFRHARLQRSSRQGHNKPYRQPLSVSSPFSGWRDREHDSARTFFKSLGPDTRRRHDGCLKILLWPCGRKGEVMYILDRQTPNPQFGEYDGTGKKRSALCRLAEITAK